MSPSVPVQNRATSAPCAPQRQWRHVLTRFLVPATAWRDAAAGALAPRWAPDVRSHALSRDSAGAVSALEQQQRQPQQGRPAPNGSGGDVGANLSGVWGKDERRSDLAAFERSLDLLGINGVQRVTAKLIDGIEIRQDAAALTVSFLTVVPFFKVTERFPFMSKTTMGRRDLRKGRQEATARRTEGGARVEMKWGEPLAGSLVEDYTLLPDGAMRVRATTTVGGRSVTADSVYTRSGQSKEELLAQRRKERR